LEKGAEVTVLDGEKRSAVVLTVKNNHGDVAIALVKAGADQTRPTQVMMVKLTVW
jgi:hypothetical protein